MTIDVYEGERSMVENNHLLGLFHMIGLPPGSRGDVGVRITYKIDANGMLQVMAENIATKETKEIVINPESGRLSQEDVDRMVEEAEKYAQQDALTKATVNARNELESMAYQLLRALINDKDAKKSSPAERKNIEDTVDEIMEWLDENQDAKKEEFENRHAILNSMSASFMSASSSSDANDDDSDESKEEL